MNALALAFGMLTRVPVRRLPRVDSTSAGWAMTLAPVTALPVPAVVLAAGLVAERSGGLALPVAVLVVGAAALYSRGMHLDGLADTADGLSATGSREDRLAAMKASDIGPSGVAVLVLVLLLQCAATAVLLPTPHGATLAAVAWLGSRAALVWGTRAGVPAAAATGLGATVAGTVPTARAVAVTALVALVSTAVAGPGGAAVLVVGLVAAVALLDRCRARLGGVTGDVLGALVETALTAGLLAAVVLV